MQKKINEILSIIDVTLVLKYLETIVGFGSRMMKVAEKMPPRQPRMLVRSLRSSKTQNERE